MTRTRVEGLIAAFPKLMSVGTAHGKTLQHTFVETDAVRYVYQPMEGLYLLLITTKGSNIVEDLETLRLLSKVVPDVAGSVSEEDICKSTFDLIFAFDEVLSAGGYRDGSPLSVIKANLEMSSHEEKLHNMIKQSKEDAAKDEMRRQAKTIKERQLMMMKAQMSGGPIPPPTTTMAGFGGGGAGGTSTDNLGILGLPDPYASSSRTDPYGGSSGGGGGGDPYSSGSVPSRPSASEQPAVRAVPAKGMKLGLGPGGGAGSKGGKDSLLSAMAKEDGLGAIAPLAASAPSGGGKAGGGVGGAHASSAAQPAASASLHPVSLLVEEKITASMTREGDVTAAEVKGMLSLVANSEAGAAVVVALNKGAIASCGVPFTVNTHPKIDKKVWETTGVLAIKDGKAIPVGTPIGVLRWAHSDSSLAPLTVNCWPESSGRGASMTVNLEYESHGASDLLDVQFLIPGVTSPPKVLSIDGQFKHDPKNGTLLWRVSVVDSSNRTGSLEFTVEGVGSDADVFFPVTMSFRTATTFCPVEVTAVRAVAGGDVAFDTKTSAQTETYMCS